MVDAGYLTTMKIPLVAGRHFTNHDTGDAQKVLIVNETMAKKMWPNGNVVGQFVLMNNSDWQVVGVVKNVRHGSLEQEGESEMYMPITQQPDWGSLDLVVRSRMTPASLAPEVRAALRRTDPALPVSDFQTLGELVQRAVSPRRFVLQVLGAFAVAALILASLGIYAVVSYSVGQRMQEFGIRMALGASGADVVRRVMMKTLALTATGIVIGLCGSLAVSKALSALLYGIESTDVVTFAAMATVLTGVALVAGYVPARRATRIDLASVLRGA
jgi:predicted permease